MHCAKCSMYLLQSLLDHRRPRGQEDAGLNKAAPPSSLHLLQFYFLDKWQRGGGHSNQPPPGSHPPSAVGLMKRLSQPPFFLKVFHK